MPNAKKIAQVAEIQDKLNKAASVVLAEYRGLTVAEITTLRRSLREQQVEFKVYKNRLVKRALDDTATDLEGFLIGPTALAFSYSDPVAPAKVLAEFAKEHTNLILKAALVEGEVLDKAKVERLSTLPGREELLQQLVSTLAGPMSGLVRVLQGPMRNMVNVLQQIKDKKES